ncbi:MAG: DUF5677 domain-containing protein [Candidatus Omnitrophota bacterium]
MANKKNRTDTPISKHKLLKKELKPPFLQIGNLKPCSWIDDRLPEMLWAVLIVDNVEREKALSFFRFIADYVHKNKQCYDVTLTGISRFAEDKRKTFIKTAISWSEEIKNSLRPLILFPHLPALDIWKSFFDQSDPKEDWQKVANGVSATFWHQSQEATDCRWIKFLCEIAGGKRTFCKSIKDIEDTLRGVLEYPNYGDLRHIRPFIRASEIASDLASDKKNNEWAKNFWQYCYDRTICMPEEAVSKKIKRRQKKFAEELKISREHYFEEAKEVRNKLIGHLLNTSKTSAIDYRHECAFGIAIYAIALFNEIIFYRASLSITGRIALRSLLEAYITFKYLLKKEKDDASIWNKYRSYGIGQLKLLWLKLQESGQDINCIEIDDLDYLANEDKWIEFVPINLGHWDSTDLRTISEEVGLKMLYDKYYSYTSGYVHASWGAVRESIYQRCMNPLHRFHRIPIFDLPLMPSITNDAREILNSILELLSEAYPKFSFRLTKINYKKTKSKPNKQARSDK